MKNKRKLEDLSVDEFLEAGLSGSDTSEDSAAEETEVVKPKKLKPKENKNASRTKEKQKKKNGLPEKTDKKNEAKKITEKIREEKRKKLDSVAKHKATLEKLKEKDPEFYRFLQEEDQELLKFGEDGDSEASASSVEDVEDQQDESVSSESFESGDSEEEVNVEKHGDNEADDDLLSEDDDDSDDEGGLHQLPDQLEAVTDSEEEEDESEKPNKHRDSVCELVTIKMVKDWAKGLQELSPTALKELIQAFRAAVQQAGSDTVQRSKYKVKGSTVFNAIVRTCITEIPSMLSQFLKSPKRKKANRPLLPKNSPQWHIVQKSVLLYLTDLIELLSQLAEPNLLNVVLKHVSQMIPYYACNPKLNKTMLRKLILLWSTGEETSRVIAFLSLIRLTRLRQDTFLEFVLKQTYMSYIRNCKFTSPTTLPLINFMQRSLVEIFALDQDLTYQYAFVYIRQLAIHLRNAITVRKKETCQAVYNWQYVHSLHLWTRVLSELHPSDVLQPLIYPLVQTIIGTIKLVPTARYYPLRFHCVRALNILSEATNTYIPTLPFLTEIFDLTDFNRKPKALSFKPFNFACVLKLSKAQLNQKSFTDGVIDQLYEHLMDSFHIYAHTIGFPELALPAILQMKKFVKTCKVPSYTKQIKQIIDKVEETSAVITKRRQNSSICLSDTKAVELWESKSKEEGTPLGKYYSMWRKLRDRELQFELAGKERISTDNLPVIERRPKDSKVASDKERKEFAGLFASSSEDEEDDSNRFLLKSERPEKKRKVSDEAGSDYSDFNEEELEKLAQSASEEEFTGDEADSEVGEEEDEEGSDASDEDQVQKWDKVTSDMDASSDEDDVVEDFHLSSSSDDNA